ncbi:MAG: hypothetical protein Q4E03_02365 [Trueperella sp.]|nr:hypothetical protein [Trueperella sp.]
MTQKTFNWVDAVLAGTAVTAFYAVPDIFQSRKVRMLVKGAITAASIGAMVPNEEFRADLAEVTAQGKDNPALLAGGGAALVAVAAAGEKIIYRCGEHRKAAGVRAPHTKIGLILGLLSAISIAVVDN